MSNGYGWSEEQERDMLEPFDAIARHHPVVNPISVSVAHLHDAPANVGPIAISLFEDSRKEGDFPVPGLHVLCTDGSGLPLSIVGLEELEVLLTPKADE